MRPQGELIEGFGGWLFGVTSAYGNVAVDEELFTESAKTVVTRAYCIILAASTMMGRRPPLVW